MRKLSDIEADLDNERGNVRTVGTELEAAEFQNRLALLQAELTLHVLKRLDKLDEEVQNVNAAVQSGSEQTGMLRLAFDNSRKGLG